MDWEARQGFLSAGQPYRSRLVRGNSDMSGPTSVPRGHSSSTGTLRQPPTETRGEPQFVEGERGRPAPLGRRHGGAYDAAVSLDDFARVPLLFGPSPIHPLPRLSAALGGGVEIWAKREDCNSGIAFGGNKVRKLEYLVAEALAQGCDTLVSIGGVQSNHTRQVTGVACHLGLKAVTVQEHWVDWPDPNYDVVGNIQLTRIMGGDIRMDDAGFDIGVRDSWKAALESVTPPAAGRTPSRPAPPTIRSAGSGSPTGRGRSPPRRPSSASSSTTSSCAPSPGRRTPG